MVCFGRIRATGFLLACVACGRSERTDLDSQGSGGTSANGAAGGSAGSRMASGGTSGSGTTTAGTGGTGALSGGTGGTGGGTGGTGALSGGAGASGGSAGVTAGVGGVAGSGEAGTGGMLSSNACPTRSSPAAAALPNPLRFQGAVISSDESNCRYELGAPQALPVLPATTRLLFHFDVNADGVDDLFMGEGIRSDDADSPVTLLVSTWQEQDLSFERLDCELSFPASDRSYFARDVNRDGTLDLIVGTMNGLRVLVQTESGLLPALEYQFADDSGSFSLLDVAVGDFDADGSDDLAIGFDGSPAGLSVQTGSLLFSNVAAGGVSNEPIVLRTTPASGSPATPPFELGYLTTLKGNTALFGIQSTENRGTTGWIYEAGQFTEVPIVGNPAVATFVQSTLLGGSEFIFTGGDEIHGFDPFETDPTGLYFFQHAAAFTHAQDHEAGGGNRRRSYYLLDLDGDGDDDLVELNSTLRDAPFPVFAFRTGDGSAGIWVDHELLNHEDYLDPGSETPFLALGAMKGRLLLSSAQPAEGAGVPSINALACVQ